MSLPYFTLALWSLEGIMLLAPFIVVLLATGNQWLLREKEYVCPREDTPNKQSNPKRSALYTIQARLNGLNRLYTYICIYV